jgi:hypothetical protein
VILSCGGRLDDLHDPNANLSKSALVAGESAQDDTGTIQECVVGTCNTSTVTVGLVAEAICL